MWKGHTFSCSSCLWLVGDLGLHVLSRIETLSWETPLDIKRAKFPSKMALLKTNQNASSPKLYYRHHIQTRNLYQSTGVMKIFELAILATVANAAAGSWIFRPAAESDRAERYQVLDQPVSAENDLPELSGVWLCSDAGFNGYCQHRSVNWEECRTPTDFLIYLILGCHRNTLLT